MARIVQRCCTTRAIIRPNMDVVVDTDNELGETTKEAAEEQAKEVAEATAKEQAEAETMEAAEKAATKLTTKPTKRLTPRRTRKLTTKPTKRLTTRLSRQLSPKCNARGAPVIPDPELLEHVAPHRNSEVCEMRKEQTKKKLRDELQALRSRYDSGAVAAGVYAVIREIELEIAWAEHSESDQE